ncbi:AB-hydrolase YheT [Suhomyces tanzawaensis NRRL Y-17324]|uniref:AB-hydrolase YheT n=1 Tax=Suhomyces tanzawaensis NRRL Y-17324 TaxID=984487 RepID=A0A1E4SR70_9ASCO|nr:AB-hydrolase YheT [Suhomyces tanzawaensis NRRL Y-17324]ODV82016.1 AB-hydrolase YheT [Suhomyces tanzawaensis NRRL Y-17324]
MHWNWFTNTVETAVPKKPVKFVSPDHEPATMTDIIAAAVPEFASGASCYMSPMLPTGHLHTAYTALNKFEYTDKIHYKRRILTIEDITYQVKGEALKYDGFQGASTIAVDYVVPEDKLATGTGDQFRPASQTIPLLPRTAYLDPAHEHEILDNDKPLLIALHGLAGGSYESYIRAQLAVMAPEFDALVLNARGCANHTITSPQLFNGLWTNDLRYLINHHIRPTWPNKRIYLMGFSLGGAIVANYVGQEADAIDPMIKAAVVVGSPWNFTDSSLLLRESLIGRSIYSSAMCQNLLKLLRAHDAELQNNIHWSEFIKNPQDYVVSKLWEFDDVFTSKIFGFNNGNDYYRHASPDQRLYKVRVPTIILNSKDDPIVGSRTLPYHEVKINPYTHLITSSIGGHLGWFKANGARWNVGPVAALLKELDANWKVDHHSIAKEDLPYNLDNTWQHDRIVSH